MRVPTLSLGLVPPVGDGSPLKRPSFEGWDPYQAPPGGLPGLGPKIYNMYPVPCPGEWPLTSVCGPSLDPVVSRVPLHGGIDRSPIRGEDAVRVRGLGPSASIAWQDTLGSQCTLTEDAAAPLFAPELTRGSLEVIDQIINILDKHYDTLHSLDEKLQQVSGALDIGPECLTSEPLNSVGVGILQSSQVSDVNPQLSSAVGSLSEGLESESLSSSVVEAGNRQQEASLVEGSPPDSEFVGFDRPVDPHPALERLKLARQRLSLGPLRQQIAESRAVLDEFRNRARLRHCALQEEYQIRSSTSEVDPENCVDGIGSRPFQPEPGPVVRRRIHTRSQGPIPSTEGEF